VDPLGAHLDDLRLRVRPSVTIPACEPVSETPRGPGRGSPSRRARSRSARRSRSACRTRAGGAEARPRARAGSARRSCRPSRRARATTFAPDSRAATSRCATRFSLSVSPTEEPPNFMTTSPGVRVAIADRRDRFKIGSEHLRQCRQVRTRPDHFGVGHRRVRRDRGRPRAVGDLARRDAAPGPHDRSLGRRLDGVRHGLALAFLTAVAAWRRSPWVGSSPRRLRDAAGRRRLVRRRPREPRRRTSGGHHASGPRRAAGCGLCYWIAYRAERSSRWRSTVARAESSTSRGGRTAPGRG
jgi:hypothetical protein